MIYVQISLKKRDRYWSKTRNELVWDMLKNEYGVFAAAGAAGQPSTTVAAISEWRWGSSPPQR